MELSEYRHEERITVDRPPEVLYDLVSDVTRMGRWSPVCTGGTFDEDGEWFTGTNAMGDATWDTRCRVVTREPGREFAFVNHGLAGTHEMVRWGFRLQPVEGERTELTQTWEVLPDYAVGLGLEPDDPGVKGVLDMMKDLALQGMPKTLEGIKADAEQG